MKTRIKGRSFPILFLGLLTLIPLLLFAFFTYKDSFVKLVNADAFTDACVNQCVTSTGDPDFMSDGCSYLCNDGNTTYGCLLASEIGWFDPAYSVDAPQWCIHVQTPTQMCIDRCKLQNDSYDDYESKCTTTCTNANGDSTSCWLMSEMNFDASVNREFCSLLDFVPTGSGTSDEMAIFPASNYYDVETGYSQNITGTITSLYPISYLDIREDLDGGFYGSCDYEQIGESEYSFSCYTGTLSDPNSSYFYFLFGENANSEYVQSDYIELHTYVLEEPGGNPEIRLTLVPSKTINDTFLVRGIAANPGGTNITDINILSNYVGGFSTATSPCTAVDGTLNSNSEEFSCSFPITNTDGINEYCVEYYDQDLNRIETCSQVIHTTNVTDGLVGYWSLDGLTPLNEITGYGGIGAINHANGLDSVPGYLNDAMSFYNGSYFYTSDYNEHFSFSNPDSEFIVETYVYLNEAPGGYPILVSKMSDGVDGMGMPQYSWSLGLTNAGGISCAINGYENRIMTHAEAAITFGQWNKLACSWNAGTHELKGYINDEEVASTVLSPEIIPYASDKNITFAARQDGYEAFTGQLDEIKIYDLTVPTGSGSVDYFSNLNTPAVIEDVSTFNLTGTSAHTGNIENVQYRKYEVGLAENDNWQNCTCTDGSCNFSEEEFSCSISNISESGTYAYQLRLVSEGVNLSPSDWETAEVTREDTRELIAWWGFDNATTLYDYSGNNYNGTIGGTTSVSTSPVTGSSTNTFDTNTIATIPDPTGAFDFAEENAHYELEMRIKQNSDTLAGDYDFIQKYRNDGGNSWDIDFMTNRINGAIYSANNEFFRTSQSTPGTTILSPDTWHTVRFVYSNTDQTVYIQVDGNTPEYFGSTREFPLQVSTGNLVIKANNYFRGEIDDIKIFRGGDAKAPDVSFEQFSDLDRVTSNVVNLDVTVTDQTGIENFEYLFHNSDYGIDLDSLGWIQATNPTTGNWGDKQLVFNIESLPLTDGPWYLYVRATDSYNFKHLYENGWFTTYSTASPSAMPYLHFIVEAQDTTPPYIFAHSIIPNPTVDKSPGVRGYVRDFEQQNTGDTSSNILSIEYRLNGGNWNLIPSLDNSYDSPNEEFYFLLNDLTPGEYTLDIRATDASGNSTDDNDSSHTETFTIYELEETPDISVISKEEDFNDHTYHDVLFSDGVWGNGILRLRQSMEFNQTTALFTNNNDFGWEYGDTRTGVIEAYDGNVWVITNNNNVILYNVNTTQYEEYLPFKSTLERISDIKDFVNNGRRYLLISYENGSTLIYDLNNTPFDSSDDIGPVDYGTKDGFNLFRMFTDVSIDTRNGKFAYFAEVNNPSPEGTVYFYIWIDTKGTIMDVSDDTYVTWGAEDNLFYRNEAYGYQDVNDFTATYFDQSSNIFYAASFDWSIYQCTDGGTPEDKSDDSCQRFAYPNGTYQVFDILKDSNGQFWFGGNLGLTRLNNKGTLSISDDEKVTVLSAQDLGSQEISKLGWIEGEYPVGDEIWMMTRNGYLKALEMNFTYNDTLDDTYYNYKIKNLSNRQGNLGLFTVGDRNTIYTSIQGYGLQKIELERDFEDLNKIEMLPIPPDGILAINYIDLEEVLGSVTNGSAYTFNDLVSYEVSNDSGVTWYPISEGNRVEFPTPDYKLKLRINLTKGSSPIIDLIRLSYITYPEKDPDLCDIRINTLKPQISTIQNNGSKSLVLNFTGISGEPNIQGYTLEYGLSETVFQYTPVSLNTSTTTYTLNDLSPNTKYFFRIKGITDCTTSDWSSVLSATTSSIVTTTPKAPTPKTPAPTEEPLQSICGEICNIDSDCTDSNNFCNLGKCELKSSQCDIGQKLDDNKCSCVQETSIGGMCGQPCTGNSQCTEANNECNGDKCVLISCPSGYKITNDSCGCILITKEDNTNDKQGIFEKFLNFIQNLDIPKTSATTTAALVGVSLLSIFVGKSHVLGYALQSTGWFLSIFKIRKKDQEYGLVYNSITKEPINRAIVRIYNENNKLVLTTVTNIYGVFDVNIKEKGKYTIEVSDKDTQFPSRLITGNSDGIYNNIYKGEEFFFDSDSPLNFSIPLDPINEKSEKYTQTILRNRISTVINLLQNIFFVVGILLSTYLFINYPSTINTLIMILYIIILIINIYILLKGFRRYGSIKNQYNDTVPYSEIGLKDLEFGEIKYQRIADEKGRYRFIIEGGDYELVSLSPKYSIDEAQQKYIKSMNNGMKVINRDVYIKEKNIV